MHLEAPKPAKEELQTAPVTKAQIDAMRQQMFALNSAGKSGEAGALRKKLKELEQRLAQQPAYSAQPTAQARPPVSIVEGRNGPEVEVGPGSVAPSEEAVAEALLLAKSLLVDPVDDGAADAEDDPSLQGDAHYFFAWSVVVAHVYTSIRRVGCP